MKSVLKVLLSALFVCTLLAAATLMVIKYFDVLVSLLDRLKETFEEKKHALFSSTCCACDDDDEPLPEVEL